MYGHINIKFGRLVFHFQYFFENHVWICQKKQGRTNPYRYVSCQVSAATNSKMNGLVNGNMSIHELLFQREEILGKKKKLQQGNLRWRGPSISVGPRSLYHLHVRSEHTVHVIQFLVNRAMTDKSWQWSGIPNRIITRDELWCCFIDPHCAPQACKWISPHLGGRHTPKWKAMLEALLDICRVPHDCELNNNLKQEQPSSQ